MPDSLRVLIVEDSLADAFLIVRELSDGGFEIISERVANATAMQAALEGHAWDLIISNYSTRCDRRQRELWFESPLPPLARDERTNSILTRPRVCSTQPRARFLRLL